MPSPNGTTRGATQAARAAKARAHFAWQAMAVARKDLTSAFKSIAWVLALHRNVDSGRCDPSFKTLGDESGTSESTAKRAIARFERLGMIAVERTAGGNNHSNHYRLTMPPGVSNTDTLEQAQGCQTGRSGVSNRASKGVRALTREQVEHVGGSYGAPQQVRERERRSAFG